MPIEPKESNQILKEDRAPTFEQILVKPIVYDLPADVEMPNSMPEEPIPDD